MFKTDVKEHLKMTDGRVLQAIGQAQRDSSARGHDAADRIINRRHYRVLWKRNPADLARNPDAGASILEAARSKFGLNAVRRDSHHPSGPLIDFPIELYDKRTVSAQAESDVLANIPAAAIDYVFVQPEIADQARTWLENKRQEVLDESLEKE